MAYPETHHQGEVRDGEPGDLAKQNIHTQVCNA